MKKMGFVSIVGAGPGDPDLLTQKAVRRLAEADLLLFDALISLEILEMAPQAQRFCVGKRARRKGIHQETIHKLMIRAALSGKRVVRLKCGDPFVLGRGGEEALALRMAEVPFEVVPGITSAIAAPQLSNIPITHRSITSGFTVVSGHAESAFRPILEAIIPNSLTVIILMGIASRADVAALLLQQGWKRTTPTAILIGASTPKSRTWIGTLQELGSAPIGESLDDPGTIVIGDVVSFGAAIERRVNLHSLTEKSGTEN